MAEGGEDKEPSPNLVPDAEHPAPRRQSRTVFEAEALVAFAGAVAVGVFAIPVELTTPVRWLITAIAFVFILVVFGRYPQLSRWLVAGAITVGPFVLVALVFTLVVVLVKPSLRPSAGVIRVLFAGTASAGGGLLQYRNYLTDAPHRPSIPLFITLTLFNFGTGCIGCVWFRSQPGGVAFTENFSRTFLIGIVSYMFLREITVGATRVFPAGDGPLAEGQVVRDGDRSAPCNRASHGNHASPGLDAGGCRRRGACHFGQRLPPATNWEGDGRSREESR